MNKTKRFAFGFALLLRSFIHSIGCLLKRCCVLISTLIFKMINLIRNLHWTEPKRKYERKKCMQSAECLHVFGVAASKHELNMFSVKSEERIVANTERLAQTNYNSYEWMRWYVIASVQNTAKMQNASTFTVMGRFSGHFPFIFFTFQNFLLVQIWKIWKKKTKTWRTAQ